MKSVFFGLGGVAVAVTLGMSSCGSDAATTATTAVKVSATNYITIPPTPSTDAPPTSVGGLQPEQAYTIVSGDYPLGIAKKFNVSLDDLLAINIWTLEDIQTQFPGPGTVIKIPAGGTLPGEVIAPAAGTATTLAPVVTAAPTTTVDICTSGEYTILDGDTPIGVAKKLDTTVEQLALANSGTSGYSSFYVGLKIRIPAKTTDC